MKTKIFTLISAFSFAISSAECSEEMINDGGVQDDHATIEYGYNAEGDIVARINKKIYLCKTPVMERRQALLKTPKISKKRNIEVENNDEPIIFPMTSSFDDVEGSIDPYKAFNPTSFDEDLEEDIYKTPVMERRQGLPKTPPSPGKKSLSDACVKKHKISKKSKYERRNRILVWDDVDGSTDTYKAFNPISFDEDLEEDPTIEGGQGLPTINMNEVSLRWLPMPPSFSDFEKSIDSDKSSNT